MSIFKSAALLAGGKSSRMGFNKQMFHVAGERLFETFLPTLTKRFDDVMIVTTQPEIYEGMGVRAISDIIPGYGPLSGIHAAICEAECEYVYIIACDMPEINLAYIDYMVGKLTASPADACITKKGDWIEPFHGFYSKRALPAIESDLLAGIGTIYQPLQKINTLYISEMEARRFTPDWSLFHNLNTLEEYKSSIKNLIQIGEVMNP